MWFDAHANVGHFWFNPDLSPFFGYAKQFLKVLVFVFCFCVKAEHYYFSRHFCFCFGGTLHSRLGAVGDDAPNG